MDLAGTATMAFRAWGLVALFSTSFYGYLGGGLGDIVVGLVVRAATPGAGVSGRATRCVGSDGAARAWNEAAEGQINDRGMKRINEAYSAYRICLEQGVDANRVKSKKKDIVPVGVFWVSYLLCLLCLPCLECYLGSLECFVDIE